jgi:site-specific recombinase XerC
MDTEEETIHTSPRFFPVSIFQATGDLRKVSLWLGHAHMQTAEIYLRADPMEKIEAIEGVTPPALRRGRFTVPDKLIASLRGA